MKHFYLAVQIEENGKGFACDYTVAENENLLSVLAGIKGAKAVNICQTRKQAREIAEFWNDCARKNGVYLFGDPAGAAGYLAG